MDPKTQSEQMEDVRPGERGFINDAQTDAEALDQIEQSGGETSSDEDCD